MWMNLTNVAMMMVKGDDGWIHLRGEVGRWCVVQMLMKKHFSWTLLLLSSMIWPAPSVGSIDCSRLSIILLAYNRLFQRCQQIDVHGGSYGLCDSGLNSFQRSLHQKKSLLFKRHWASCEVKWYRGYFLKLILSPKTNSTLQISFLCLSHTTEDQQYSFYEHPLPPQRTNILEVGMYTVLTLSTALENVHSF